MVPHTQFDARNADPLMRIVNLSKSYVQRRPLTRSAFTVSAFEDVNLTIHRGSTLAIVGESGAGKSTLAKCLALIEKPTAGEILFGAKNLLKLGRRELFGAHRQIQLIFQDPTSALNPRLSAEEIIAEPLAIQRIGTKDDRRVRALELMEQVGLSSRSADKRPMEFSGGQRQRLAIARALALEPKLLILDEALASLDLLNQQMILSLLADLRATHSLTYVHISHDLRLVSEFADEVAVMSERHIVEHKPAAELFARPEHPDTQALLAAMPSLESICLGRLA
ncbi:MAG: ATP-binding cassette domain-containing protein [Candidatus Acidiferrales bacterium]